MSNSELHFMPHSLDRMKERGIKLNRENITVEYINTLPYYTDKGCYKYLDWKHQVVFYVRKNKHQYKVETIIKTNRIQMLRNMCDAHRMLCENKYHPNNKCIHCDSWKFEKICRDHLFGTCKRGENCKFIHKNFD